MILIVIGLAAVDFVTGIIKATVLEKVSSKTMRTGGLKKAAEILIMTAFCGLEVGLEQLCIYYGSGEELGKIVGLISAVAVFIYISIMEIVSILENYAAIYPEAHWAKRIIKKLQNIEISDDEIDTESEVK
jgi:hypothetical protein